MPRQQRFLKFCLLLFMPIGVIAAVGAFAGTFWYNFSGEKYLNAVSSPSGKFRAVLVEERDNHCVEDGSITRNSVFLKLERKSWLLKTGEFVPFCATKDAAAGLSIHWSGADELSIDCPGCGDQNFEFYDRTWGEASFRLNVGVNR